MSKRFRKFLKRVTAVFLAIVIVETNKELT